MLILFHIMDIIGNVNDFFCINDDKKGVNERRDMVQ